MEPDNINVKENEKDLPHKYSICVFSFHKTFYSHLHIHVPIVSIEYSSQGIYSMEPVWLGSSISKWTSQICFQEYRGINIQRLGWTCHQSHEVFKESVLDVLLKSITVPGSAFYIFYFSLMQHSSATSDGNKFRANKM